MGSKYSVKDIKIGTVYKHFKGNLYTVIGVAAHTESLENLVLYSPLKDPKTIWARPVDNFLDKVVDIEGKFVNRFTEVSNEQ